MGSRLRCLTTFTLDSELPFIIPGGRLAQLVMEDCNGFCHAGQDGTLARFRAQGYWVVSGSHLAKRVVNGCVPCRKEKKL